jgi:hypothetical protein
MDGHDGTRTTTSTARGACLVEGCNCKDARILSTRRASYFASVAKARGETADRVVAADDDWRLPVSQALDVVRALAARTVSSGLSAAAA